MQDYTSLKDFTYSAAHRCVDLVLKEGVGEDPDDHYFAYASGTDKLWGYFACHHGDDEGAGDWASSKQESSQLGVDVWHPRQYGW